MTLKQRLEFDPNGHTGKYHSDYAREFPLEYDPARVEHARLSPFLSKLEEAVEVLEKIKRAADNNASIACGAFAQSFLDSLDVLVKKG